MTGFLRFFSVLLPCPFSLGGTGPRSHPPAATTISTLVMPDSDKASGSSDRLEDALLRLTNQQMYLSESVNSLTLLTKELF